MTFESEELFIVAIYIWLLPASYVVDNFAGPRKAKEVVGTIAPLVEKMWGHFSIWRAIDISVCAIILYLLR